MAETEQFKFLLDELMGESSCVLNEAYLVIVWDIGRQSGHPIGGLGVYKEREVLFLHSSNDIYYIFDVDPEDMKLFKSEHQIFRSINGYTRDYGPAFEKRHEFDYSGPPGKVYRPGYDLNKFRVKLVGKIEEHFIYNIFPHIAVGKEYEKYYD
jgi:hypothetical protein